jgi:hypothetical protein
MIILSGLVSAGEQFPLQVGQAAFPVEVKPASRVRKALPAATEAICADEV